MLKRNFSEIVPLNQLVFVIGITNKFFLFFVLVQTCFFVSGIGIGQINVY
jgi:hypothetical protein